MCCSLPFPLHTPLVPSFLQFSRLSYTLLIYPLLPLPPPPTLFLAPALPPCYILFFPLSYLMKLETHPFSFSVRFQIADELGLEHISYGSGNTRYIEVKKRTVAEPTKKSSTSSDVGKSPGTRLSTVFIVMFCPLVTIIGCSHSSHLL